MTTTTMTQAQARAKRLTELEAERQKLEAEAKAFDKTVEKAYKTAGKARTGAVEQLYDLLGIEAETTARRNSDGSTTHVQTDKSEEQRAERLVEAVTRMKNQSVAQRSGGSEAARPSDPRPGERIGGDGHRQ